MNVFYCCCIHDPWLAVAKKLELKGAQAAYWIGWPEGEDVVRKNLEVTYHDISLAWKGIFPKEIEKKKPFPSQIDGLKLQDFAYEELMAIRMMDRLDRDRKSFTFTERQFFFRRLLSDWLYILQDYQIDLIIFPSIPHRVFDYVIYIAAKMLGIQFLTFKNTRWPGEIIPLSSTIENIPNLTLCKTTKQFEKIGNYFNTILNDDYDHVEPDYMVAQKKDAEKRFSTKVIDKVKHQPQKLPKLFRDVPIYWKKMNSRIEDSTYSRFEVHVEEYKGNLYKKKLRDYYESKCVEPDLQKNYILVALHYQPEETSIPSGNIYADQLLMVRALLKHTSNDTQLFVKEHASQFMPSTEGQTSRTREFYDQLLEYKRVHLISTKLNPFLIVDKANSVATLTGNICLEALIRSKPVVLFGNAWYEHVHGVLKVDSKQKMQAIESHFLNFEPNLSLLKQQFNNILAQCIRANHYKFVAEKSDITSEESITNLVDYITTTYLNG